MGGRGRDAVHMAKARAKRAPFTNARDGRVKRAVRWAFWMSRDAPLTTTQLLQHCYFIVRLRGERYRSWHRSNVSRAADLVALRVGRATSPGRPIVWSPRPELMQDRRWVGLKRGKPKLVGAPEKRPAIAARSTPGEPHGGSVGSEPMRSARSG
jgi:hypothetical protein